ncbi:hypothetical protein [Spiroplasma endosymbiont of Dioctria linearis]|uniref:hypothetical protein n=1 Tax=Spiroplasma endosymbiont of Dioctria linearis TaxID=3066290 RepID=UPI00313B9FD4
MKNNQKIIYNAGSLFTNAQCKTRKEEGDILRKMFPELLVENPADIDINSIGRPSNKIIFEMGISDLKDADYVILEIDGWDSGTYMEFGLLVQQAIDNKQKYLLPVISDFRFKLGILRGEIPGFSLNEMISGAFYYDKLNQGDVPQMIVCDSHESACKAIKAIESGDTKNFKERFDIKNLYLNDSVYHGFKNK